MGCNEYHQDETASVVEETEAPCTTNESGEVKESLSEEELEQLKEVAGAMKEYYDAFTVVLKEETPSLTPEESHLLDVMLSITGKINFEKIVIRMIPHVKRLGETLG